MNTHTELNPTLKRLIQLQKWSGKEQNHFSVEVGLSPSYIATCKIYNRTPRFITLKAFAEAYHCSLRWLVDGIGEPFEKNSQPEAEEQTTIQLTLNRTVPTTAPENAHSSVLAYLKALVDWKKELTAALEEANAQIAEFASVLE